MPQPKRSTAKWVQARSRTTSGSEARASRCRATKPANHGLRHTKCAPSGSSREEVDVSVDGVVLVHGSNLSAACWDSVVAHMHAPAVAVDLPGRGNRPADILTVTLADCVDAVIETAD